MEIPPLNPDLLTAHARSNRRLWNEESAAYQQEHGPQLSVSGGMAWGVWQLPEAELRVLGDVRGKDMLELGCGAAQWSIKLALVGARPVGLDLSEEQLRHARRLMTEAAVDFPLVHASAEAVPLPDESFDIVFCDWGGMTFGDPHLTVPEAARLLRPGGFLAFSGSTPIAEVCTPILADHATENLVRDYFGLRTRVEEDWVEFMLPYGEWIRLFRRNGLVVEDLIELRPPADAVSSYRGDQDRAWARRWPLEQIWKVVRSANGVRAAAAG
jgi:SAM-dependent methyltransferase